MKNLVIGAALGFGWDDVKSFVLTLRNTGYKDDICLFVSYTISKNDQQKLTEHGVRLIKVDQLLKYTPELISKKRFTKYLNPLHRLVNAVLALMPLPKTKVVYLKGLYSSMFLSIACSRYFYYYNFLRHKSYKAILLADVKDVIFQSNPFASHFNKLHVAIENTELTLANEPCNNKWINVLYGEDVLKKIDKSNISCSGTTLGDAESIKWYLLKMINEASKNITKIAGSYGYDQGIHNYLLWNNELQNVEYNYNAKGFFLTMLTTPKERFIYKEGYFWNDNHTLVPIVHQYNWFPDIKIKVLENI